MIMYQFEFTGRCPSKAQIKKHVLVGLKQGDWAQVSWGENCITVERNSYGLDGFGWIRALGGNDLAREIAKEKSKMKIGDNVVVLLDGDIKGAEVLGIAANGDPRVSLRDYDGDYMTLPRRIVFTASEWEQVKGEYCV
jgi:hypothetical protein